MERKGGEPDVIGVDKKTKEFIFCDCAEQAPKERRSMCYDGVALKERKEHKPKNSAMDMAKDMGEKPLFRGQLKILIVLFVVRGERRLFLTERNSHFYCFCRIIQICI